MADRKKEEHNNFNTEIKALVTLLASGAFVKLHRKFLEPSSETYWGDQVVNWLHQMLHSFIGIAIQIVLLLWVVKCIIVVWKGIKDRWK